MSFDIKTVKNNYAKLSKIDYSMVDKKYLDNNKNNRSVDEIRDEAIKFLALAGSSNRPYSPSKLVDNYWHEMILNTRVYSKITKKLGKMLQHVPADGSHREFVLAKKNIEAFRNDYSKVFGIVPKAMWKNVATSHNCTCSGA